MCKIEEKGLVVREETLAGIASGFVQTLFGHPFDTIKVRMQASSQKSPGKGRVDPLLFRNLYRGFWYPFAFNGAFSGLTFGCNEYFRHQYFQSHFQSGAAAGVVGAVVTTPVDLFKVRAQSAKHLDAKRIGDGGNRLQFFKCFPFRGFVPSLLREIPSTSVYFGLYHWLQRQCGDNSLLHGGAAGVACWLVSYPADTIKTRIQSGQCQTINQALAQRRLWTGITPCLIRSFIVNACGFYTYERFKRLLKVVSV